jgi:hypothetical protein
MKEPDEVTWGWNGEADNNENDEGPENEALAQETDTAMVSVTVVVGTSLKSYH